MIKERILALAYTPANRKHITDWAPFGGNTLAEIVDEHNKRQRRRWEENDFRPDEIEKFMEVMDIVRHDLNAISKLLPKDYNSIVVLLADRDIDAVQQKSKELKWIRDAMSQSSRGKFYLTQIGQKEDPKKLVDFFKGRVLPYPTTPPHVLNSQTDFEFLLSFLHTPPNPFPASGTQMVDDFFPPPPPSRKDDLSPEQKRKEYLSAHAKVQAEVRDAAIEKGLSVEETQALGQLAIQQELALRQVARQFLGKLSSKHVVLDSLRTSAPSLAIDPFQKPRYNTVELLKVKPRQAIEDLSAQKRRILSKFGLIEANYTAISVNTPEKQNLMKQLGKSVTVDTMSANLPTFKTKF